MGNGIGKYCKICGEQLNWDDGFNEKICSDCQELIPKVLAYLAKNRGKQIKKEE